MRFTCVYKYAMMNAVMARQREILPRIQKNMERDKSKSMKDAVIFLPLGMETDEPAHPYQQPAEIRRIADASPKQTGYVLFPKVTKFSTYLFRRYGKRIEAELAEGIMAGEYAAAMRLYDAATAHVSCRFSHRMSLWRVNRYEFITDVPVEISWKSSAGEETAEGYVSLNCCLDEDFCYFIDSVSIEKPDRPLIRLDEYLVPIMSYEDLEDATRTMWEQYLPEVFTDHEWLNPYRLAERMGLKVTFHLLYRRKKNRGLLFWKDGTVKVVTHTDRNDLIEEVKIEAGTIVINDDGEDMLEREIVAAIKKYLSSLGSDVFFWKEHGGPYGCSGIPDVICCYKGRFLGLECKLPGGRLTELQKRAIEKINRAGGVACRVESVEDVKRVIARVDLERSGTNA